MLPTDGRSAGDRDLPGSAGSNKKVHVEARPRDRKFKVSLGHYQENSWTYQLAKDGGTYYLPIRKIDEETRAEDGTSRKRYELDFSEALFTRLEKDKPITVRFEDLIPQLKSTKDVKRVNPDTGEETTLVGHRWFGRDLRDRIKQAINIRKLEAREVQNLICNEERDLSDNAPSRELESSGEREDEEAQPLAPRSTFDLNTEWWKEIFPRAPTPGVPPAEIPKIEDTNKGPKSSDSPTTQDAAIWKRIPEAQEGLGEGGRKDEDMGERILGYHSKGLIHTAIECDPSTPHYIIAGLGAVLRSSDGTMPGIESSHGPLVVSTVACHLGGAYLTTKRL